MKDIVTGRNKKIQFIINNLFPKSFRLLLNPNRRCIEKFVQNSARSLSKNSKVLDAGAGPCPYKHFFKHCEYESTDFKKTCGDITFVSSLDHIPRPANTYDSVLSTEVLEHVEYPEKVLKEMYRVLKKNGRLFMTVPQGWMIHQEPYNFFYFTKYGLISLIKNSGFKKWKITSKGGYFWFLADAIRFNGILYQYKKYPFLYYPLRMIEFPITNLIFPLILFPLDFLDKEKKWTLGYLIEATK